MTRSEEAPPAAMNDDCVAARRAAPLPVRRGPILFVVLATAVFGFVPMGRAAPDELPLPTGSIDRLAVDFAGRLGPALEGRRVPALALLVQLRQPPGLFATGLQRLVEVLGPILGTRLSSLRFRRIQALPSHLSDERVLEHGIRHGANLTLVAEVVETGGRLHLRGRLFDTDVTLWGRLKGGRARPLAHLHVSSPLDAELRSYLLRPEPASAITCSGAWTELGSVPFWAAALGDVDADGRAELVLLGAEVLLVLRWSTVFERWDTVVRTTLPGPAARSRTRFPLASLVLWDLDGDRRLDILARSSERSGGSVMSVREGRIVEGRRLDGYPVGVATVAGQKRVALALPLAGRAEWNGREVSFAPAAALRLDLPATLVGLRFVPGQGAKAVDVVGAVSREGRLRVQRVADGRSLHDQAQVGSVFGLGDLTGDGLPEVITTTPQSFATSDAIAIHALGSSRPLCRVKGFEGSVTALAVGDVRTDGTPRVAVVVWNERLGRSHLMVVR